MRIESKNLENGVSERRKEAQSFMEGKSSRQDSSSLRERILAASGEKRAGLVLKGARVVNVFTGELEEADVAIEGGYIAGVGSYEGETEVDLSGKIICPGFIDGHIHLESSMVRPAEFERAVLPHGTTAVITDPHEIANVAGTEGIDYMLYETENLMLDVFFMLPSCVPAADLEESGAVLRAEDLRAYYENPRVLGLAEMMNAPGTVRAEKGVLAKLKDCSNRGKRIDGHAPGLSGYQLNAYCAAGVASDHECSEVEEALEKLRRGQWIMVREGTAARNLEGLISLCKQPYANRCMFVTDDKHPGDLQRKGHMDGIIRKAVRLGADPVTAIQMATLHPARYFGLRENGAVAPGYRADLVVLEDLEQIKAVQVYKNGKLAAQMGELISQEKRREKSESPSFDRVHHSFHMKEVCEQDFRLEPEGAYCRVIELTPGELLTKERNAAWVQLPGFAPGVNPQKDIIKLAVLERHKGTGHKGIGFLGGYGLKAGAVATSVAHDSHNLIVAGVSDRDMALAAETVRKAQGGIAVVKDGAVLGLLPLPIGGLMNPMAAEAVDEKLEELKRLAAGLGVREGIDPFMTLAFVSLPVIPKLRLNTCGLIDTQLQEIRAVSFS